METVLIDYGHNSLKIGKNKNPLTSAMKVFGLPPNEIDLSIDVQQKRNYWEKIESTSHGQPLKTVLGIAGNEKRSFLLSQHMDFEFKKNTFVQKSFEVLFERNNFAAGQMLMQPILIYLALNESSKTNLLIVDSGEESTYVIPIYDQFILRDCIERTFLGGRTISKRFEFAMAQKGVEETDQFSKLDLQILKEQSLKVCPDFNRYSNTVLKNERFFQKEVVLPDGQRVKLAHEVYEIPEAIFSPMKFGADGKGIVEKLFNCVKAN
jgi:hypothetical protein